MWTYTSFRLLFHTQSTVAGFICQLQLLFAKTKRLVLCMGKDRSDSVMNTATLCRRTFPLSCLYLCNNMDNDYKGERNGKPGVGKLAWSSLTGQRSFSPVGWSSWLKVEKPGRGHAQVADLTDKAAYADAKLFFEADQCPLRLMLPTRRKQYYICYVAHISRQSGTFPLIIMSYMAASHMIKSAAYMAWIAAETAS
ncbi:hypothetical protein RvY_03414 [Ramazzottius varieornatus]|uniref:Uncharacterized protein n=1 Tax=Ramazzottius varieornatus TaxID=947166 RepID=A0A1D1UXD1_RAMVA|nr:hypothetical protein RvY_03414 [Ramazzottius varieornatus]